MIVENSIFRRQKMSKVTHYAQWTGARNNSRRQFNNLHAFDLSGNGTAHIVWQPYKFMKIQRIFFLEY